MKFYLLVFGLAFLSLALTACSTSNAADKPATAYISIDDGEYPTFTLRKKGDPGNVTIQATQAQIAKWKAATLAYQAAQKEMGDLVSHYEPIAIDKTKIRKIKP